MNRNLRIALIGGATLLVILVLEFTSSPAGADSADPYATMGDFPADYPPNSAAPGAYGPPGSNAGHYGNGSTGSGAVVTIMDQGLGIPMGQQVIPPGWRLDQDVAVDPGTGQFARNRLDLRGPNGELSRFLGIATYGEMMQVGMQQLWQRMVLQGLHGEVGDVSLGALQPSRYLADSPSFRETAQKAAAMGTRIEGLEASITGRSSNGQQVEGLAVITHFPFPQVPGSGTIQVSVVLSPRGRLNETIRTQHQMAATYRANPAHEQRVAQISQQHTQSALAASGRRFDAHQEMMRGMYAAGDQQMESWRASGRSSDEMHRRTIHGINETADVYNNQTGQTHYGVQGGYNTYWTDRNGNVVGSQGYDNPDPMRYERGTNLDDRYRQGGN
jgi:hypothetical protein